MSHQSETMIPEGASLMIGGFMGVDTPERLVDELVRQGKRNLVVIAEVELSECSRSETLFARCHNVEDVERRSSKI